MTEANEIIKRDIVGNCDLYAHADVLTQMYFQPELLYTEQDMSERTGFENLLEALQGRLGRWEEGEIAPNKVLEVRNAALQTIEVSLHGYSKIPATLFAVAGGGGVGFYRAKLPAHILLTLRGTMAQWTADLTAEKMEPFKIIVLQRQHHPWILKKIEAMRPTGKKFVYELDDLLHDIPKHFQSKEHFHAKRLKMIEEIIAACDLVTVSTRGLKERYNQYNPNIEVVPNCIPFSLWPRIRHQECSPKNPMRVLISGSPTHEKDVATIEEVVRFLVKDPRFTPVFWGQKPYFHWLGRNDYEYHKFSQFEMYPANMVEAVDPDIALIPLSDNAFNRCKSNLKWLEYSAAFIPVVASDVVTYSEIWDGKSGFLRKNDDPEGWIGAIEAYYEGGPPFRESIAEAAHTFCKANYNIEEGGIESWEKAYMSLLG